jgi:hypothetical protein
LALQSSRINQLDAPYSFEDWNRLERDQRHRREAESNSEESDPDPVPRQAFELVILVTPRRYDDWRAGNDSGAISAHRKI